LPAALLPLLALPVVVLLSGRETVGVVMVMVVEATPQC
jgi:hypothetical protein